MLAVKDGTHSDIAMRNDKERITADLFRDLAGYVNIVTNGSIPSPIGMSDF